MKRDLIISYFGAMPSKPLDSIGEGKRKGEESRRLGC
jgi:hypothetical protein